MKIELMPLENKFRLSFHYNKDLVNAIKDLGDYKYNPADHSWIIGFSSVGEINDITDMLAKYNYPADMLNRAEANAKQQLSALGDSTPVGAESEAKQAISLLPHIGRIIISAYLAGDITQQEQADMLSIINTISLKDLIK